MIARDEQHQLPRNNAGLGWRRTKIPSSRKRGGEMFESFARSVRHRAPARRQLLSAAQRDRQDRVGRVRGAFGREDARTRDPQIGNLVGLAVAVDHRVRCASAHDGSAGVVG